MRHAFAQFSLLLLNGGEPLAKLPALGSQVGRDSLLAGQDHAGQTNGHDSDEDPDQFKTRPALSPYSDSLG